MPRQVETSGSIVNALRARWHAATEPTTNQGLGPLLNARVARRRLLIGSAGLATLAACEPAEGGQDSTDSETQRMNSEMERLRGRFFNAYDNRKGIPEIDSPDDGQAGTYYGLLFEDVQQLPNGEPQSTTFELRFTIDGEKISRVDYSKLATGVGEGDPKALAKYTLLRKEDGWFMFHPVEESPVGQAQVLDRKYMRYPLDTESVEVPDNTAGTPATATVYRMTQPEFNTFVSSVDNLLDKMNAAH